VQPATTNRKLMWWGINILVLLYAFVPVFWLLSLSLKNAETLNDGKYFPTSPTGDSYKAIFKNDDFVHSLINSIGICLISTLVAIVVGTMAAYAIARLQFPARRQSWRWRCWSRCSRRSPWSLRCSRSRRRSGCSTPGPA
jgi:multiple sugar transport system permease protein